MGLGTFVLLAAFGGVFEIIAAFVMNIVANVLAAFA